MKRPDDTYYQVCVRCGVEYGYDWERMKRTAAIPLGQSANIKSGAKLGQIDRKSA
jgi:hypothetical protein